MREIDVAIIGAGAAGVAAARRLADARVPCVLIEARNRVGGRAFTLARRVRARSRLRLAAFGGRERMGRARAQARLQGRRLPAALGAAGLGRQFLRRRAEGILGRLAPLLRARRGRGGQGPLPLRLLRAGQPLQRPARRGHHLRERRRSRENDHARIRALSRQQPEQAHRARLRHADHRLCGRPRRRSSTARCR